MGQLLTFMLTLATHMAITWFHFHLKHTPFNKIDNWREIHWVCWISIQWKLLQYWHSTVNMVWYYRRGKNQNSYITENCHLKWDISASKIKVTKELPPCLKTTKQEKSLLQDPFDFSLNDHESILDENKTRDDIDNKIIVN